MGQSAHLLQPYYNQCWVNTRAHTGEQGGCPGPGETCLFSVLKGLPHFPTSLLFRQGQHLSCSPSDPASLTANTHFLDSSTS